jgi:uncharacterized protein (TIGR00255 family)
MNLRSMTGFGKAEGVVGSKKLTVEVRALNSKQLDLSVRLPSIYREKEMDVRMYITEHVIRGKVDVLVYYETMEAEKRIALNRPIMEAYYKELKQFSDEMGMSQVDILNAIIRIPEVLKPENTELSDEEWQGVFQVMVQAVQHLGTYRKIEGDKLLDEFNARIDRILEERNALLKPMQERNKRMREKLRNNVSELIPEDKIDQNRFEQELIYYLERLDISEEYQRLETNCSHFKDELRGGCQGKKLGFVAQEIGREINTIGSKANDAEMQRMVVVMKDELEKIKEQINNVL